MKFYFPWDWDKHLDQISTLFEDCIRNYSNDFSEMIVIHGLVEEPISDDLALAIRGRRLANWLSKHLALYLPGIAESER
ncbi:hypothetical protein [Agrobacterium tumefaciens]|uniref:hypothetical protein n=1 Tax=Agrobacterium tumefaciens TaxID=358 RepID=UPI001573A84C|nr:hypothetical protein [Agrobacterium tumefaciens]NTD85480.1 hypothetical protein [Agrobacterium tumefaciens]NTD90829.1 hypothetical protein [Agrobacterium tumefaciens]NTE03651.1 hypothetical protein [Agrobacterium tumefaciens]NTE15903.1 hypothetical protein [Agrobacterium tumefaciens]NTE26477.1 hypothetical protein [Agrobacterium tumefaciens]